LRRPKPPASNVFTAYTTVVAAVIARYQRMKGREVFFLVDIDKSENLFTSVLLTHKETASVLINNTSNS